MIGLCGLGFVGSAMQKSFIKKGLETQLILYDKYKEIGSFNDLLETIMLFLALPTPFSKEHSKFDLSALFETLALLNENNYKGIVIIKSTVEPQTCDRFSEQFGLNIVHNPEFLTARQAFHDFHNQNHIVLGKTETCDLKLFEKVVEFYQCHYPTASISKCKSVESETMKIAVNTFYSVKVQFFTEMYLLSQKVGIDYNKLVELMVKNGWINKMHTLVPGPDGNISYGGACLPKDSSALLHFMETFNIPNEVIKGTVTERNTMRND